MNYTNLMKDAWRFIWRRKAMPALSFTSMLAATLAYLAIYLALLGIFLGAPGLLERIMGIPGELLAGWPTSRWGLPAAAVGFLLWPLLWFVGLGARGGMIALVDEDEREGRLGYGSALGRGLRLAPRLAAMSFLLHLPVIVLTAISQLLLLMMIPRMVQQTSEEILGTLMPIYALSFSLSCLTYALMLFIQFIYAFAYRGIVMENRGAVESIRHGWRVLRRNAGDVIPLSMIYIGIALLLVILLYAAFFALYFVLLFGLLLGGGNSDEPTTLVLAIFGAGMLLLFLVGLVVSAIQAAWRSTAFTKGYRYWAGKAAAVQGTPIEQTPPLPPEANDFTAA